MDIELNSIAEFLLAIGGILLLGMITDYLRNKTSLPCVTLLILFGIVIVDQALDLILASLVNNFILITDMA